MWRTFFEALGAEVMLSPTTTRAVLAEGSSRVVAETCLPVKVFIGHAQALARDCDFLFIPSIRSVEPRVYNCSKFLGLPDLVKAAVPGAPPILDVNIDVSQGRRELYHAIYGLGRRFTWNPWKVKQATEEALRAHRDYQRRMRSQGLMPPQVLGDAFAGGPKGKPSPTTIAVIGHPYLVYDEYVNHRLLDKLWGMGVRVVTSEMVREEDLVRAVVGLEGRSYWTYESEVVGSGVHYLNQGVDGVIGVVAFGCGPDSLMMDLVERLALRTMRKPFMCLTLDEHTAEAGLVTRLEAFLDMIQRRKRGGICG
jgi:predicted nucleotide-binding protein (sugar kinase/HSP70/actin superfamily)